MNVKNLGLMAGTFDIALSGFMGWYDCFDFEELKFTQADTKAPEIWRVLKPGGKFACCSWEEQEDLRWMEEEMLRYYPALLQDGEYLEQRPIGMAYEKASGYEIILQNAGFRDIESYTHAMTFVSSDEDEWWRQMSSVGWKSLLEKIDRQELERIKEAICKDLLVYKRDDGIHFQKMVFFMRGVK